MSEKALWQWLNKKMGNEANWRGFRFENCSNKGIPDSIVSFIVKNRKYVGHLELKDWSGPKKHPLSREQLNFIRMFGGAVLIKAPNNKIVLCCDDLEPLLIGDLNHAINTACFWERMENFSARDFLCQMGKILQTWRMGGQNENYQTKC